MLPDDQMTTTRSGLVEEFTGTATAQLAARPRAVLDAVTDLERLSEWNDAIESVADAPEERGPGAQWVVVMHPAGWPRWRSRSTIEELDHEALRFVHTTRTDDGNPSWAVWTWQARPDGDGTELSVSWRVHPRTLGRRAVLARLRRRMLQREVRRSLDTLDTLLTVGRTTRRRGGASNRRRVLSPLAGRGATVLMGSVRTAVHAVGLDRCQARNRAATRWIHPLAVSLNT